MAAIKIEDLSWIVLGFAWIPFTIGLGLIFYARLKDFGWILFEVYLAWGVQVLVTWFFGVEAGTFLATVVLTRVGNLIARNPKRPPALVIFLGGVFVLTVGSIAVKELTTLAGEHLIESVHDLEMFCVIAEVLTF